MKNLRIIPRLDVKGPNLVKGIQLEGLRVLGKPEDFAYKYYTDGADEIIYIDIVASLYDRNSLYEIITRTAEKIFIPLTVGGGIRTIEDIKSMLRAGADKVAINTAAVKKPQLLPEAVQCFGSQCIVGSIEAKIKNGSWEAYINNGREPTGKNAIEWAKEIEGLGVGEILVTSIDREGTKKGFDIDLVRKMMEAVSIPVIACGGAGRLEHINDLVCDSNCDAVAIASVLHYNLRTISEIKDFLRTNGIQVRI